MSKSKGDLSDNVEVGVSLFDAIEFLFHCFLGGFILPDCGMVCYRSSPERL